MLYEALLEARRAAVALNPVSLILTRKEEVKGPSGLYTGTSKTIAGQRARIVAPAHNKPEKEQVAVGGNAVNAEWLILFESPAADVKEGDTFQHPATGGPCKVIGLQVHQAEGRTATITGLAQEVR